MAYILTDSSQLRFPTFHSAMLEKPWMDPSEMLGRIRVVIAEGIKATPTSPFSKIQNIVGFAFIHAPQSQYSNVPIFSLTIVLNFDAELLEDTCIAWPNKAMWDQETPRFQNALSPPRISAAKLSIHGHSPRSESQQQWGQASPLGFQQRKVTDQFVDPFLDNPAFTYARGLSQIEEMRSPSSVQKRSWVSNTQTLPRSGPPHDQDDFNIQRTGRHRPGVRDHDASRLPEKSSSHEEEMIVSVQLEMAQQKPASSQATAVDVAHNRCSAVGQDGVSNNGDQARDTKMSNTDIIEPRSESKAKDMHASLVTQEKPMTLTDEPRASSATRRVVTFSEYPQSSDGAKQTRLDGTPKQRRSIWSPTKDKRTRKSSTLGMTSLQKADWVSMRRKHGDLDCVEASDATLQQESKPLTQPQERMGKENKVESSQASRTKRVKVSRAGSQESPSASRRLDSPLTSSATTVEHEASHEKEGGAD